MVPAHAERTKCNAGSFERLFIQNLGFSISFPIIADYYYATTNYLMMKLWNSEMNPM